MVIALWSFYFVPNFRKIPPPLGLPAREDGTGIPGVLSRTIPIESLDVTSWSVRDPEQVVAPVARELDLDREVSINPEQTRSDIWQL